MTHSNTPIHQWEQRWEQKWEQTAQIIYLGDMFERESTSGPVERYTQVVSENTSNIMSHPAKEILQKLHKMGRNVWIKEKKINKEVKSIEQLLPCLNLFECQYILWQVKKERELYRLLPLKHYTRTLECLSYLLQQRRNLLRYGDDWEV